MKKYYLLVILLHYNTTTLLHGQTLSCNDDPSLQLSFVSDDGGDPCVYTMHASNPNSGHLTSAFFQINNGTCTSCPTVSSQTNVVWTITGNNGDPCGSVTIQWAGFITGLCGTQSVALPVELTDFKAAVNGQTILLQWQTASEENNAGFEIQRSSNPEESESNWEVIGFVTGNGTSLAKHNYEFIDNTPFKSLNYYRLKQIDFDGQFEYSNIVTINSQKEPQSNKIAIYPNPVQNQLFIENATGVATIYNVIGQPVKQFVITPNNNRFILNTAELINGHYHLQVTQGDGTQQVQSFIKQ